MSALGMLLAAALAAPAPAAPYPRPGQPGYSVAKAFTAIVRRDEEVNIQALSQAFGLPELLNGALTWHGPFASYEEPRFSAYYTPSHSAVGISSVVIVWDVGPSAILGGKHAISYQLTLHMRADACPSEVEMAAATGVAMTRLDEPGYDGGPPYTTQSFAMPDGNGYWKIILYSFDGCELTAIYTREN